MLDAAKGETPISSQSSQASAKGRTGVFSLVHPKEDKVSSPTKPPSPSLKGTDAPVSTDAVVVEEAMQQTEELGMPIVATAIYLRTSLELDAARPRVLDVLDICKRVPMPVRTAPVVVDVEVVAPVKDDGLYPGGSAMRKTVIHPIVPV